MSTTERDALDGRHGLGPEPPEEMAKQRAAMLRSMTMTRMLDYGMDHWDATRLVRAAPTERWEDVATELADSQLDRARAAAHRGDTETAVSCYRRATAALVFAQMAFNRDTPAKRSLYERLSRTYQEAADLDTALRVERLPIPFAGSHCNAWLVRPQTDHPGPVVVVVGGQSGWGPAYHPQAESLARRGLSTLLLEAPGQGETRIVSGLHLDDHADEAFSATVDVLQSHAGIEGPFGVWGNSFGGLLAARAAVHDERFEACCVNGAPARPEPAPFRTASEQSQALLGVDNDEDVAGIFRRLWLDPADDRMGAALLVLHGGADPLISLEQQQPFLGMSEHAALRVWEDGEHTIYNHSAERTELVGDWFRAQLDRRCS